MKYPEKEERIFPIPELKEIPSKEVLDLYVKKQKVLAAIKRIRKMAMMVPKGDSLF